MPQTPREAFFELLSKEATPFVIGDDERRTLELRLWRWPDSGIAMVDGGSGLIEGLVIWSGDLLEI